MDLSKYQELTGVVVSSSKTAIFEANIKKSRAILETLLGYSLLKSKTSVNYYEEKR